MLVIFVRPPSGNKCSPRCRDLTVRALRGKPAYSYGLLWADRDGAPGEALEADVSSDDIKRGIGAGRHRGNWRNGGCMFSPLPFSFNFLQRAT